MASYVLKGQKSTIQILFKYDLNGNLIAFEISGGNEKKQLDYAYRNMPWHESMIQLLRDKKLNVVLVPEDLSFNAFWTKYNYKVGDKKRCEKLWNLLDETKRTLALVKSDEYNRYLSVRPTMEKAYPETYLAQARYENDYR